MSPPLQLGVDGTRNLAGHASESDGDGDEARVQCNVNDLRCTARACLLVRLRLCICLCHTGGALRLGLELQWERIRSTPPAGSWRNYADYN